MENEEQVKKIESNKNADLQFDVLKDRLGKIELQLNNLVNEFPSFIMTAVHQHLDRISQVKGAIQLTRQEIKELEIKENEEKR